MGDLFRNVLCWGTPWSAKKKILPAAQPARFIINLHACDVEETVCTCTLVCVEIQTKLWREIVSWSMLENVQTMLVPVRDPVFFWWRTSRALFDVKCEESLRTEISSSLLTVMCVEGFRERRPYNRQSLPWGFLFCLWDDVLKLTHLDCHHERSRNFQEDFLVCSLDPEVIESSECYTVSDEPRIRRWSSCVPWEKPVCHLLRLHSLSFINISW